MSLREPQVRTVRLEVEGEEDYLRQLKDFLELQDAVGEVSVVDEVSDDVLDTIELTLDRVEEGNEITLGQLVDRSGVPREDARSAVKKLGRTDELSAGVE